MREKWITKLPELLGKNITSNDILLVKLITLTRIKSDENVKYETSAQMCAAALENYGDYIRWHIHDMPDDSIIIDTPVESTHLGHTNLAKNCSEQSDCKNDIDSIYIVTACKIIRSSPSEKKFTISFQENGTDSSAAAFVSTETLKEAKAVVAALVENDINAKITETN